MVHDPIVDMHGSKTIVRVVDDDLVLGDLIGASGLHISGIEVHRPDAGHIILLSRESQAFGNGLESFPVSREGVSFGGPR